MDDFLPERQVNRFDLYVGTSAGAIVAACTAAGLDPRFLSQALAGTVPGYPRLTRKRIYRPNVMEFGSRLAQAGGGLVEAGMEWARTRRGSSLATANHALASLLPSGILSTGGLEAFLRDFFRHTGTPDTFGSLPRPLVIVATDIETGERVAFSEETHPELPLSRAICASAAIPVLFSPVIIGDRRYLDGAIKGQAAIDIAVQRGASLVIVINGIVPLNTGGWEGNRSVYARGLRGIQNQVFREVHHENLLHHLEQLREHHPEVDFLLIEPHPDDEKMPFHQAMSFNARLVVLQHGYESVVTGILGEWERVAEIFARHGLVISRELIDRKSHVIPSEELRGKDGAIRSLRRTVLDRRLRHRTEAHPTAAS